MHGACKLASPSRTAAASGWRLARQCAVRADVVDGHGVPALPIHRGHLQRPTSHPQIDPPPRLQAVHWAIDELKATVPIWKKEFFEGGEVWKENEESRRLLVGQQPASATGDGGGPART